MRVADIVRSIFDLSSQPHTDTGEGTVETLVLFSRCIDPAVHRAEEEIGAITEAELCAGNPERRTCESADIRHGDSAGAVWISAAVNMTGEMIFLEGVGFEISAHSFVMASRFLAADKNGSIHAPVQSNPTLFGITNQRRRGIPRN